MTNIDNSRNDSLVEPDSEMEIRIKYNSVKQKCIVIPKTEPAIIVNRDSLKTLL